MLIFHSPILGKFRKNWFILRYGKSLISTIKLAPEMSDECQFDHFNDDQSI